MDITARTIGSEVKRPIFDALLKAGALVVTADIVPPETVLIVVACVATWTEVWDVTLGFWALVDGECDTV